MQWYWTSADVNCFAYLLVLMSYDSSNMNLGNIETIVSSEAVVRRCFIKKMFLEILQNSQENTCAKVSFLIKLLAEACNFVKKETLAHVFSYEFSKILRTPFLTDHLRWLLLYRTSSPERCIVTYLWVNLIFNWIIHLIIRVLGSILNP